MDEIVYANLKICFNFFGKSYLDLFQIEDWRVIEYSITDLSI